MSESASTSDKDASPSFPVYVAELKRLPMTVLWFNVQFVADMYAHHYNLVAFLFWAGYSLPKALYSINMPGSFFGRSG